VAWADSIRSAPHRYRHASARYERPSANESRTCCLRRRIARPRIVTPEPAQSLLSLSYRLVWPGHDGSKDGRLDDRRTEAVNAMTRRLRYAVAGGLLGLVAPAGLMFVRLRRRRFSPQSVLRELQVERETYIYSAASTSLVVALFGGVLGHHADRLAQLATTDSLTGLFNPRAFHDRLRQELARATRYQEPLAFLIVDLDGLKRVNDQHGHSAGDAALQSVADAIRSELRENDFGARLGGDEFGVLVPRADRQSAVALAERLQARVVSVGKALDRRGATVSIGIASMVPSKDKRPAPVALMTEADKALYLAKREGGNRIAGGEGPGPANSFRSTKSGAAW